jgi:NAD(P)-dependent dehydrogenase (short-subunit alcohol dehydrogenase family)
MASCVITGASTGIGEACAHRLDAAGWTVFAGVRRQPDADRLKMRLSARARTVLLDVTDSASIAAAAAVVDAETGGALDALVNNAGIAVAAPLEIVPLDDLRRQLEVNVIGQIAVTQAFLPMLRRSAGRIVLMGSVGGRMSTPFLGPYCSSKFALEAIADALRVELQPWNMHVSIVEPGSIATPIWAKGTETGDDMRARIPPAGYALYERAMTAFRRMAASTGARGIPADAVAKVVEHALASSSPRSRYLVGTDARVRARLAACIPDRWRDALISRAIALPRRGEYTSSKH